MTWTYNNEPLTEIPDGYEAFVYVITNTITGRKYVGKKNFWTRQKDRKTGRRKTKEGPWQSYWGSCDELIADVKELGEDKFLREILYLCPHKKSMSFYETMEQFKRDVILREDYYNTNVEGKFFSSEVERIYNLVESTKKEGL